nr:hypothetical protein [Tanacetum cinerariifolium]
MDITIDQQVTLDKALVPHASRLRIGKSNFRLRSDLESKESTLQVVYDVLKLTPFYKAFLVTADVPEIYIEMIQICPRIPDQQFYELPFEEEILTFLKELGYTEVLSLLPLAVGGDIVVSELLCFFLTLAFVLGGSALLSVLVSRNKLYRCEHVIIPGKVPVYLVSLWDGFILSHEEIDDDLGEARIVYLITFFGILVLYMINKILP